jgi:hypothetical protein
MKIENFKNIAYKKCSNDIIFASFACIFKNYKLGKYKEINFIIDQFPFITLDSIITSKIKHYTYFLVTYKKNKAKKNVRCMGN